MSVQPSARLVRRLLAPPARRGLLTVVAVWAAVVVITFAVISRLDRPTASAPPDRAQPVVGRVAVPPAAGGPSAIDSLPPLALALEQPLPQELRGVTGPELVERLEALAAREPTALNLNRLGAAAQGVGDAAAARDAFRRALAADPADLGARVGLILVDGSAGGAALDRAARELAALAGKHPKSQLVLFNQGLVAVYRRDTATVLRSWRRAAALDPRSPLGRTAAGVVAELERRGARPASGG